ncbi:hypothetical protein Droror1_Dr00004393 [Drosera rotundifolia]
MASPLTSLNLMKFTMSLHSTTNHEVTMKQQPKFYGPSMDWNIHGKDHHRSSYGLRFVEAINERVNGTAALREATPSISVGLMKSAQPIIYEEEVPVDADQMNLMGRLVEAGSVYRQHFVIRCYEIGPDKTATVETILNLLQEAGINHMKSSGLSMENDYVATPVMSLMKLVWVVSRFHVKICKHTSWGNIVEVDAWFDSAGKNSFRRDWIVRDYKTKQTIAKATSTWVIMNKETRKLSKIPEEVKQELYSFHSSRFALKSTDEMDRINKITEQSADLIQSGIAPKWSDLDGNQHVNHIKYVRWILESIPVDIVAKYDITNIILEYRRECRQNDVLESLFSMEVLADSPDEVMKTAATNIESTHLLRKQDDKAEIVRAKITWRSKRPCIARAIQ